MDYFEHYTLLPPKMLKLISETGEMTDYNECEAFLKKCEALGYTFEYGLDAEPYGLEPMIRLEGVACVLDPNKLTVHPITADGSIDIDTSNELTECMKVKDWSLRLTSEDRLQIFKILTRHLTR